MKYYNNTRKFSIIVSQLFTFPFTLIGLMFPPPLRYGLHHSMSYWQTSHASEAHLTNPYAITYQFSLNGGSRLSNSEGTNTIVKSLANWQTTSSSLTNFCIGPSSMFMIAATYYIAAIHCHLSESKQPWHIYLHTISTTSFTLRNIDIRYHTP